MEKYISIHPLRQNIYDILFYSKCIFMEIYLVSVLLKGNVIEKKVNLNLYHSFFCMFYFIWSLYKTSQVSIIRKEKHVEIQWTYVKYIASPGSVQKTGCSGCWDDPEGWDGEWGGRGVQDGEPCTPRADSCQCMAKTTTILQSN